VLYKVANRNGEPSVPGRGTEMLRLLEIRLKSYLALAESLVACLQPHIRLDIDGIMQAVEVQSTLCGEIANAEDRLRSLAASQHGLLSIAEKARIVELERLTVQATKTVSLLNRSYASLVRKAAHNNAVLRNLYANALVYADPRAEIAQGRPSLATEEHYG
jgi:hypothetical protein